MANNLKILESTIEAQIDPNGAPGSILALNHQDILKSVLNNVGKSTGFHFKAEKDPATIPTGKLSFNGNAFNNLSEFLITVSELSLDLNDFGNILKLYVTGTTLHFKDYVGRSAFFEFVSFVAADDGMGNNTYEITVKGFADNSNYTYQDAESENATLSFHANTTLKTKVINFGVAEFNGGITFAAKINALPDLSNDYKTGFPNELVFFTGIVYETAQNNKPISAVYILKNQSPGIYGVGGNIVVAIADFLAVEYERGGNGGGFDPLEDPNAFVHDLGEIADGDYLTVINAEPTPFFVIDAETNWYFTLTVGGAAVIVAHVGADDTYGLGQAQMVDADLLIVFDEREPVGFPYDLTGISDLDLLQWNATTEQFEPVTPTGGTQVASVTGDGVDNSDPINPIMNFPDADEVDDSTTTNKFLTQSLKTQITTNQTDISALMTSYSRRLAVIDFVDNTAVPPTEVSGDRYILDDTGASHANWDGAAAFDIVEYDGANWIATTPLEGYIAYVDALNMDALFVDDGSPQWEFRESDVASAIVGAVAETTIPDAGLFTFVDTVLKNITWANVKVVLQTFFDAVYEKLLGIVADGSISGTFTFNHDNKFFGKQTMTAATTFSDSNLVIDGVARGVYLTGDFVPTFPAYWTPDVDSEPFDGTLLCRITWDVLDDTGASEDVRYFIKIIT